MSFFMCPVTLPQEILNVTDRVQSVSSLAVAPCAQQLLTCNKWVLPLMSCFAAFTSCAALVPVAGQSVTAMHGR